MAIDIYQSRRTHYFECKYYKRNVKGVNNSNILTYNKEPSGTFTAKIIDDKNKEHQDFAGVIETHYNEISIQTNDKNNVEVNDLVYFMGSKWFVLRVSERIILKNTQFNSTPSKTTTITLRKGD